MFKPLLQHPAAFAVTLAATGILFVTMGVRQSLGLFVSPLNTATGLGIVTISLAMAVGQFVWGAAQPLAGALADRYGPRPVLVGGLFLAALGLATTPWMDSAVGVSFTLGILVAAGWGASSFSVLLGAAANRLPAATRGAAAGMINAGGSLGQFVFAPVVQKLIQLAGWMGAFWALAAVTLFSVPLASRLTRAHATPPPRADDRGLRHAVISAFRDRSYWFLHAGFFTCGFHIAFLVTHLPGEIDLCGLPSTVASGSLAIIGLANVFGSLYAGHCVALHRSKLVLAAMYASRAVLIALYLAAPRSDLTFYLFAAGLGFTWLATVPPTAALVGKLFGVRYLATLFGLTLLTHQIGGFLGAWLGGIALAQSGDYGWMWYADMALAALAALANLPIREAPVTRPAAA